MSEPCAVLVVDDEAVVLEVMKDLVRRAGGEPLLAGNADDALALARSRPLAAAVVDYQMPEIPGPDLLRRIAEIQPEASRIVMTGMPSLDAVLRAVNEGEIYRFVTKPWVSAEMVSILKGAIHRHELLKTNRHLREESVSLNRKLAETNALLDKKVKELEEQGRLLAESRAAIESSFHRSLELCRRILNTFNPLLAAQAKMTSEICDLLVAQGQFTPEERRALLVSSRLYDFGLTGVPSQAIRAIQSGGPAPDEETERTVRNHTIYGQTLAAFVDPSKLVSEAIRAHHERPDGKGYPDGLRGADIPWVARCLAVVVCYVEKVSAGLPHEEAVASLLPGSGSAFDPQALQLFLACVRESPEIENLREVRLEELQPGMRLAADFTTPSGLVLYTKGQRLDEETIARLRKQFRYQPSGARLTVLA